MFVALLLYAKCYPKAQDRAMNETNTVTAAMECENRRRQAMSKFIVSKNFILKFQSREYMVGGAANLDWETGKINLRKGHWD